MQGGKGGGRGGWFARHFKGPAAVAITTAPNKSQHVARGLHSFFSPVAKFWAGV